MTVESYKDDRMMIIKEYVQNYPVQIELVSKLCKKFDAKFFILKAYCCANRVRQNKSRILQVLASYHFHPMKSRGAKEMI